MEIARIVNTKTIKYTVKNIEVDLKIEFGIGRYGSRLTKLSFYQFTADSRANGRFVFKANNSKKEIIIVDQELQQLVTEFTLNSLILE